ncbi:sodium/myo-inositol cotransporter-like [Pecten maximus]|uniref:sodium/myo-inositol cotransporter-like n=1 Tax=Pecten maximus TaxID=6579 RepID=UPI001458506A|nr:sodium/myo-inositol cotransporter-like [Pecten maximus]
MVSAAAEAFRRSYNPETVRLTGPDVGVVVAYFVAILAVGAFAMWRANRGTVSGYFLAGRSMTFIPLGASLFVSNIGTEHFIGLAGSGAANGISVGAWEFNAILLLQLLGWIFIPVYIACGTYTMPEYLSKRFGGTRLRVYFAVLSLILYIFTKCSGDLFTGALFIQQSLRWDLYLSIFVLVLITGILTMTGGLTAVIYTDTLQALLMVGGGLTLMGIAFSKVGGYDGMVRDYKTSMTNETFRIPNATCHEPDVNAFRMLREADDDYMPWPGFLLGQTPGSIWYWCADQVIVQRLLAAKSVSHAKGATLMAGFIKILPLFMMVMPGMISRILFPDEVACVDKDICYTVCQSYAGCTNIAYPRLVLGIMPEGLRGLMMAVMIAALMSDLDSIFNSASTLFTIDIYKRIRKTASVKEQLIVGRVFILVMIGVSIAWVPILKETQGGQVFIYIQEITNYLAPPFAAVFLLAILVPQVNEKGAFWSLMIALIAGVTRMVLVFVYYDSGDCLRPDPRPDIIKNFHYMYFSLFITLMTAVLAIIISLITGKPDPKYLHRTTYWTRFQKSLPKDTESADRREGYDNPALSTNDIALRVRSEGSTGVKEENEPRKVYRDPGLDKGKPLPDLEEETSCRNRMLHIACGFGGKGVSEEEERAMQKHLEKVSELKQNPTIRIVLNIGLVMILLCGAGLYIFWSYWQYQP